MNFLNTQLAFLMLTIVLLFSCGPIDKVQCERGYVFDINLEFGKAKDSSTISATIFLSMEFLKLLTDKVNGEKFDATSFLARMGAASSSGLISH